MLSVFVPVQLIEVVEVVEVDVVDVEDVEDVLMLVVIRVVVVVTAAAMKFAVITALELSERTVLCVDVLDSVEGPDTDHDWNL